VSPLSCFLGVWAGSVPKSYDFTFDPHRCVVNFDLEPLKAPKPLRFGMPKDEVIRILGNPDKQFIRNPAVGFEELAYDRIGVYVSLDRTSQCNAVMIFAPSRAVLDGQDLLKRPAREAIQFIKSKDLDATFENDSLTAYKLGLSVYAPELQEDSQTPIKHVLVFSKEYYG